MKFTNKIGELEVTLDGTTGIYTICKDGAVVKETKSANIVNEIVARGGEKEKKDKFKKVPIFTFELGGTFQKATATAVAEGSRWNSDHQVWIVSNGKREKKHFSSCYLDIPENENIVKNIQALKSEKKKLETAIESLQNSLSTLTEEMMQEENA